MANKRGIRIQRYRREEGYYRRRASSRVVTGMWNDQVIEMILDMYSSLEIHVFICIYALMNEIAISPQSVSARNTLYHVLFTYPLTITTATVFDINKLVGCWYVNINEQLQLTCVGWFGECNIWARVTCHHKEKVYYANSGCFQVFDHESTGHWNALHCQQLFKCEAAQHCMDNFRWPWNV